jgi:hypothetical protein
MNVPRSHPESEARRITVRVRVAPISNGLRIREGTYEACSEGLRLRMGRISWIKFRLSCRLTPRFNGGA